MANDVKVIFHIDMNAYFCSCEAIKNPALKGKPFAVGSTSARRGVISTANYEARKYGVNSAMSTYEALRKCPHLILVEGDYELYQEMSKKFINIFYEYTNIVEQASIDEAYLDVTDSKIPHLELAELIQKRLLNELGLPCSIGIATTMFLAKMASDMKKPLGITVLRTKDIISKLYVLPVKDMYGIGKKTYPRLMEQGILTIGDMMKEENHDKVVSVIGERYYFEVQKLLTGKSDNIVNPYRYANSQSIGNSRTYTKDLDNLDDILDKVFELCNMVSDRLFNEGVYAKTVTIQIRYSDFKTISRGKTLDYYIQKPYEIYNIASDLVENLWNNDPVRLLGVTCNNLKNKKEVVRQVDLFNMSDIEKEQKIIDSIKKIEEKYGNIISKGVKK